MWYYILLVIIIFLLTTLVLSFRYRIILFHVKERISILNSFLIQETVKFSTILVPFKMGAIVTRPLLTKALSGIQIKRSFPVTIFEQFIDLGWQVLLLPILLIFMGEEKLLSNVTMEIVLLIVIIILIIIAYKKRDYIFLRLWKFRKIVPRKIRKLGKKQGLSTEKTKMMVIESLEYFSDWKLLAKISIPTLIIVLIEPLTLQVFGFIFLVPMSYKIAFLTHWTSSIIGRISGIPDGFGSRDLSLAGLLTFFGTDPIATVQIVILYRIISLIPPIAIGSFLSIYLSKKYISKIKK